MLISLSALPATAAVVQSGNLRVTLLSQVQPYKLPRIGTSPISVFVAGRIAAPSGGVPAQLQRLDIRVNRHARFQSRGLPSCPLTRVQPSTTAQAMRRCGPAVVGSGQFWAHIVLPEQGAYPTQGRLLVFNGTEHGRDVLLAHIYTSKPFATSFVIPFHIHHIQNAPSCRDGARRTKRDKDAGSQGRGAHPIVRDPARATEDTAPRCVRRSPYGTELTASLPEALGTWGYVDRIKLTLKRKYAYRGQRLSYFNAGCPAEAGISRASYPLAFATFSFAARKRIGVEVSKVCGVKE